MKKIKYLLLLGVFAVALTGCVKFNASMDIKKDKSMDFSIIYAFDKTIFGEESSLKEEDFAELKKQGYTVTAYSEGNYSGFTLTKSIANIDEVSTESDVIFDLSGMMKDAGNNYIFKVVKTEEKNTYTAKIKFNSNDSGLNSDDSEQEVPDEAETDDNDTLDLTGGNLDYSSLMANMDLSFKVTLPNGAISSNATTKEDNNKKLTWKLGTSGEEYIEFAFELDNKTSNNMILYVGIGVAALIVVLVLVLVLSKKKTNDTTINTPVVESEPEPRKIEENQ